MLFKNSKNKNLMERELLSEECQVFTEAFFDKRFDDIDAEVPFGEIMALHEIVNKILNIQDGILAEEIDVYAKHGTMDNCVISILESYNVEDPQLVLEVAQDVIDNRRVYETACRYNGKRSGLFESNTGTDYLRRQQFKTPEEYEYGTFRDPNPITSASPARNADAAEPSFLGRKKAELVSAWNKMSPTQKRIAKGAGAATAVGGLGYLAYKLWKKRQAQKAAAAKTK